MWDHLGIVKSSILTEFAAARSIRQVTLVIVGVLVVSSGVSPAAPTRAS